MHNYYKVLTVVSIILCVLVEFSLEYKILGVFPHIGRSHHYAFEPLLKGLAEKGHEVTVISHFPSETPIKNLKDISLKGTLPIWLSGFDFQFFEAPRGLVRVLRHIFSSSVLFSTGHDTCKVMLENKQVQQIKEGEYDVVIMEQFNSDCGLGIVHKSKSPFIGLTSHILMSWTNDRLGLTDNPSYVPSHYLNHGTHPGFFGVLEGLIVNNCYKLAYYLFSQIPEHKMLKEYYGDDLPPLETIARNMSLVLTNTYFSLTSAIPRAPNLVEVGGIHLQKKNNINPELLEYLDSSNNGVVLFSMGSMLIASSWPPEKLKAFQEAFAEISENVLWKWDNDTMPGASKNIKLTKWLSQYDVLDHKNVKAFITHSGMLGTIESVNCGVPMINIPIFGDQFSNAAAAKDSGVGTTIDYYHITKEVVLNALREVLDPKMQANAKRMSKIWNDRPLTPLDTAIYWIEHVARHGGKHLRPSSADLPFYKYALFDVGAFLIIILLVMLYLLFTCMKFILRKTFPTKSNTNKSKKSQ